VGDLPPEAAGSLFVEADRFELAPIVLMTPTNSMERLRQVAQYARGFVYCVARKGVAGADLQQIRDQVDIAVVGTALLEAWERGGATQYERLLLEMAAATM
jgi:tryptophan synthase alpha chain